MKVRELLERQDIDPVLLLAAEVGQESEAQAGLSIAVSASACEPGLSFARPPIGNPTLQAPVGDQRPRISGGNCALCAPHR